MAEQKDILVAGLSMTLARLDAIALLLLEHNSQRTGEPLETLYREYMSSLEEVTKAYAQSLKKSVD